MRREFFQELYALLKKHGYDWGDFLRLSIQWHDKEALLKAYVAGATIEYHSGGGVWDSSNQDYFGFNEPASQYRIAPNTIEIKYEGKKFKIDLDKAKALGVIK